MSTWFSLGVLPPFERIIRTLDCVSSKSGTVVGRKSHIKSESRLRNGFLTRLNG